MGFLTDLKTSHNMMRGAVSDLWNNPVNALNTTLFDEVVEEGTQLKDLVVEGNKRALEDDRLYEQGDISLPHLAYRHTGRTGELVGGVVSGALDLVTPDIVTDALVSGMEYVMEQGMDTDTGKEAIAWLQANPENAKDIMAGAGIAEFGIPKALLAPIKRAISAAPNYIPSYYAPEVKTLKDQPASYEDLSKQLLKYKVKGVSTPLEAFKLAQSMVGVGQWAEKGVKGGIQSIIDPEARALYDKHGINKASQQVVKDEMTLHKKAKDKGDVSGAKRHKEKAIAQINYNKYITAQSKHSGKIAKAMDNVLNAVSYGGMQPLTKANYIKSASKQKYTQSLQGRNGKEVSKPLVTSEADLSYAYDAAIKMWGMPDSKANKLVVKRNTGMGGGHQGDMSGTKNVTNSFLRSMYANKDASTPQEIFAHLSEVVDFKVSKSGEKTPITRAQQKNIKIVSTDLADIEKNGLWLSSSQVGSGIVEGGINTITKVLPNQRSMTVMSDVHDFLEKVPVLGKVLGKALPVEEFTMTPPVYTDLRPKKTKVRQAKNRGSRQEISSMDEGQSGSVSDQDIEDYMNASASKAGIAAQVGFKMPVEALHLGTSLHDYGTEDE